MESHIEVDGKVWDAQDWLVNAKEAVREASLSREGYMCMCVVQRKEMERYSEACAMGYRQNERKERKGGERERREPAMQKTEDR